MKISVVLAAGEGTRMKSKKPKVLHEILGSSMLELVIDSAKQSEIEKVCVVVGHSKEKIIEEFKDEDIIFKEQPIGENNPYGTGFAVMQAIEEISDEDTVLILNGDTPLIRTQTINELICYHNKGNFECTILTAELSDAYGYGRIVRDDNANIFKIVEQKDATEKEKLIREINSGIYVFKGLALKESIKELNTNNSQGELYLTDTISYLVSKSKRIGGYRIKDTREIIGVNSRDSLSVCTKILRQRVNNEHMLNGVTLIDSDNTTIERSVKIGRDTVIYPGALLQGSTEIGEDCEIYGDTRIIDSKIGNGIKISSSLIENSVVDDNTTIGPYAHLRPKSNVGKNTKIGNFVELKNTNFKDGSKASHLAYIGDADIGENVNIGCGVVFVNYDGKNKFRSTVKNNAFVGSNANIIAPVLVEENGYIAAGSTITKDVNEGQLAVERAKQINVDGWVEKKGLKK